MRIVAVDQGTTSTRSLVLDEAGPRIAHAVEHRQIHPHPGWVEHDPRELIRNIGICLDAAGEADAVGLANQGESCLAWDAQTGEPASPVIVWQDARTSGRIEELKAEGAEEVTKARAGLPLDPYFSASKLAWILENVPEAAGLARRGRLRLGTTDAFYIRHLTGRCATDITTASRTSLMNLASGEWDPELCRLFGIPPECLPPIRSTVGDFGGTRVGPLTASAVDQQAALYGHGCRKEGDAKVTFGTGAFALALTGDRLVTGTSEGFLPTVAWRIGAQAPVYAVDGGVYNASSAVDWLRGLGLFSNFAEIDAFDGPPAIARGIAFVPALSGLACPHWDRSAAGLWIGLSLDTPRADLVRAVLEGVGLRTAEVIGAMGHHIGLSDAISIDGGLTRNRYFCQFLADVLERRVDVRAIPELTAYGCAGLAARALVADAALGEVPSGGSWEPRAGDAARWRADFSRAVERSRNWRR